MSWLKKLFGKQTPPGNVSAARPATAAHRGQEADDPPGAGDPEIHRRFDREWEQAVRRFDVVAGLRDFHLDIKHPETHQVMKPHEGLGGTFAEWRGVRSPWDHRKIFFDLIYSMVRASMTAWQTANYLVATRRPDVALELLETSEPPSAADECQAEHCAAFAKVFLGLTRAGTAVAWARQAADARPDDTHFQTVLADALHMTDGREEAHEIYSRLMARGSGSDSAGSSAVAEMFANLFARETGVLSSPVMAVEIGRGLSDSTQAEEFWQRAEIEFYDSPYFRMQHAYRLADSGSLQQSFAKLLALAQEMPWVKEASLNLVTYFERFDPTGQKLMPEYQAHLKATITENGWTTEGMREVKLGG
ncbi:MAG: tetratricopeptide repeat protein [bacterium]|nr:tetratricopeptide repeat protein [bacterium]